MVGPAPDSVQEGIDFLGANGLVLYAAFACDELPPDVARPLAESGVALGSYARLILLGHGGRRLWEALAVHGLHTDHPVDHFSVGLARQFIDRYLDGAPSTIIYPGEALVPLGRLGALAGWGAPSPLGLGIHPEYGLWFAYRVAFLTAAEVPITVPSPYQSPCETCEEKPCIGACPAGAVQESGFRVTACVNYRLSPGSGCTDRCLARLACPVAPEHRYTDEQMAYHYGYSLRGMRR